jgi:hypothetical protein
MRNLLRAGIAGWGAQRMGCGCFGTIVAFVILYWLLGIVF